MPFEGDEGSPPPMRGKADRIPKLVPWDRITPAYAGKRNRFILYTSFQWGSPPPMRGKVVDNDYFRSHYGITPAYAGKSIL